MKISVPKITFWRVILVLIWTGGLYATFVRFTQGLGASTNLSDKFPWGIWIGFDILVGVGLAAGGFVIAATVYIFDLKDFKPIARSSVLTAFLGYLLVVTALMFDLGRPYRIWHPIIMWNPHSVMFEVGWCVMLYTSVLFLEFLPVILQKLGFKKSYKTLSKITVPVVILGVLFSMLHQSSLGTLYVIVPGKLHPLWYSGMMPVMFFVSAVAGGLAMVIFESYLSARAFGRQLEFSILTRLGRVIVVVLAVWLVMRLQGIAANHALGMIFTGSSESIFFMVEVFLGAILPIILLLIPKIRENTAGLFLCSVLVVIGFITNRLNVSITGMLGSSGVDYFPSWMEVAVTTSIVAAGFVAFYYVSKYFPVFPDAEEKDSAGQQIAYKPPLVAAGKAGYYMVSILGVILIISVLGMAIGYNYKKDHQVLQTDQDAEYMNNVSSHSLAYPEPIVFQMGEDSPGVVTFDHESHVDPDNPNCMSCHQKMFKIRPEKAGALGTVDMEKLYEGEQCGTCHNDDKAFSVEECEFCHIAE